MSKDYSPCPYPKPYEVVEDELMAESPYNWKKHFCFHIPEMLSFIIKFLIITGIFELSIYVVLYSMAELLPQFCSLLK